MTAYAGSSPERPRDLTRPDLPLPQPGPGNTAAPPPLRPPAPPPAAPGTAQAPARPSGENWHRMHYPIGTFLVAYGVTGLVTGALGWSDRREELAEYVGSGLATPALAGVKLIEVLLVALAVAGLMRRRDVWFLPALTGWLAGFAVFAVLDVFKGKWLGLLEHAVFLGGFALLLLVSYGLSVKARVGRATAPPPSPSPSSAVGSAGPAEVSTPATAPGAGSGSASGRPGGLSRTQEFALATLNRLQQRVPSSPAQPPAPTPAPAPPAPAPAANETMVDAPPPQASSSSPQAQATAPQQIPQDPPKPSNSPKATAPMPLPEPSDSPDD